MPKTDSFLIGDGSAKLMELYQKANNFSEQLVGVYKPKDLKSYLAKEPIIVSGNDLSEFEPKDVVLVEDYEEVFLICKKEVYDIFNFLSIKSEKMGDTPVRMEDLILTRDDKDFISYLESYGPHDYATVDKIARLSALREMGITEVMFLNVDNCPICMSHDHCIFNRDVIFLSLLREGFTHKYADFDVLPIIRREFYSGILAKVLDIPEIKVNNVVFKNVPAEYKDHLNIICKNISKDFGKEILFTDILRYCVMNNVMENPGMVVFEDDDKIVVHNSYVGCLGPMEFLYNYFNVEEEETEKTDLANLEGDSYYIKGVECSEYDGSYWNKQTGEKVK